MGSSAVANEFAPIPFPDGLPCIELPRISLAKLLEGDEAEARQIFDICVSTGFFYLDLTDHPRGQALWKEGCEACRVGMKVLPSLSVEEKVKYKARDRPGVFDTG